MTALRGCPYCNGWMRYDQYACNECNGTNSRKSYDLRTDMLAGNLRVAALESARRQVTECAIRAERQRIAAALSELEQRLGGPAGALARELGRVWGEEEQ